MMAEEWEDRGRIETTSRKMTFFEKFGGMSIRVLYPLVSW
jgi:hypothetical protein